MSDQPEQGERPTLNLEFNRVLCARHGEPFRERWPSGYVGWCVMGFEALLLLEDFFSETEGKQENICQSLDKKPMCCRLGNERVREVMQKIQEEFHVWREQRCGYCGNVAVGSQILTTNYWGRTKDCGFVCFDCYFNRFLPVGLN